MALMCTISCNPDLMDGPHLSGCEVDRITVNFSHLELRFYIVLVASQLEEF